MWTVSEGVCTGVELLGRKGEHQLAPHQTWHKTSEAWSRVGGPAWGQSERRDGMRVGASEEVRMNRCEAFCVAVGQYPTDSAEGPQLVRCGTATFSPAAPAPRPSLRNQFSVRACGQWPAALSQTARRGGGGGETWNLSRKCIFSILKYEARQGTTLEQRQIPAGTAPLRLKEGSGGEGG